MTGMLRVLRPRRCRVHYGFLAIIATAASACSGGGSKDSGTPPPTTPPAATPTISRNAGDAQSATVGTAVASAPSVRVANSSGAAVPGVAITFAVASGGGSVTGASATTDASGLAAVGSWILGQTAGPNSLTATAAGNVAGSPVTFVATGNPGAAAQLSKQPGGDAQAGLAGQNVAAAPAVLLKDQYGNPVPGIAVAFAVASGGGSVTGASATTGSNGVASAGSWKLGNTPGANTLTATAAGSSIAGNPATFTATGSVGPPATIAKVSGDNQVATPGAAVPLAPTVRVTDAVGNNVSGAGVTFAVTSGGGAVAGSSQNTSADGTARPAGWTLGPAAGANTVTATAAATGVAGNPLTFTAIGGLNVATYAGSWSGTWVNSTFGSTGTASVVIAAGASPNQVTLSHSGTGTVLGGSGAPLETRSNQPYTPAAFTLTTTSGTFGDIVLNVDGAGNITGSGTNVPNPAIQRWDCTGTITPAQIRLSFTVSFKAGTVASGTISVNKQ